MKWRAGWLQTPVSRSGRELSFRSFLLFVHLPTLACIAVFAFLCISLSNIFLQFTSVSIMNRAYVIDIIIFGTTLSVFCSFVFYIFSIFIIMITTKSQNTFSSVSYFSRKLFILYAIYIALSPMTAGISNLFFLIPICFTGHYLSKAIARFSDFKIDKQFPSISLHFSIHTIIFIVSILTILMYLEPNNDLHIALALMGSVAAVGFIACLSIWLQFERPKPMIQQTSA